MLCSHNIDVIVKKIFIMIFFIILNYHIRAFIHHQQIIIKNDFKECNMKWLVVENGFFLLVVVGIIHLKMVSQPHDDLWNGQS